MADTSARERILSAATERYYADGIRAVSADRLISDAGVSKVTFYRHFPTKADLVVTYLEQESRREITAIRAQREALPDAKAFLRWYAGRIGEVSCGSGFHGCPFVNARAELTESAHPGWDVIIRHHEWLTAEALDLLTAIGTTDPSTKANQLMLLRDGAMISGRLGKMPEAVTAALIAAGCAVVAA